MGSLKTLAYVGAVAMVAASAVTTAFAADFAPPPAPLMAPPPPPMIEAASGIYLRGDIGGSVGNSASLYQSDLAAAPGGRWLQSSLGNSAFVGVGIGYQFNSFIRADITAEHRSDARISGVDRYDFTCSFASGSCPAIGSVIERRNHWNGSLSSSVVLFNGYFDLGTWNSITPYIGAGIGSAYHRVRGLTDIDPSDLGGGGYAVNKSKWNMAWAIHAGLAYEVSSNLKLELGYRYLNMGKATSGNMNCAPDPVTGAACGYSGLKVKDIDSHDIKIGMRWLLADRAVASAPMMVPAMAPVIRKY